MSDAIIAIPSKGRLKEDCFALLDRAGLAVKPPEERSYETTIPSLPGVRVILISASEIADRLVRGDFHAGITGEDVLRERLGNLQGATRYDNVQAIGQGGPIRVARLGFGPARVVVAGPMSWIDCTHMSDLHDIADEIRHRQQRPLRVATKYVRLTRAFFARHLIADYRIAYSTGATEAAPASGLADVIVDITTSGATLRDNKLRILDDGEIFASEACLFMGPKGAPVWQERAEALAPLINALSAAAGQGDNGPAALDLAGVAG